MKTLLLTTAIFSICSVSAQIIITSADFADGGDTVRMSVTTDPNIDFSTTGADQNWDFTNLIAESQYLKQFSEISQAGTFAGFLFGQFAAPKYQASYYNESTALPLDQISQFLTLPIEKFYSISRLTADSLTSIGTIISVSGNLIPVKSDTIETRFDLPLHFGDNHFSRGYTYLDMNPIQNSIWIQHRTRTTEVDGWGVITTPFGTFNTLRVRHDITENDSLYIDFSGFGFWAPIPVPLSHEYEWWTNGQKEPVLKITTNEVQGNETVTSIEYRDLYRGLDAGLIESAFEFNVYPNPTQGLAWIKSKYPVTSVQIYNVNGQMIRTQSISDKLEFSIDLSDLTPGIYYMEGTSSRGVFRSKVIRD